ncbi:hypothetical protein D9757_008795 [Collybiopsis confluens]|uniref:Protein kinase domain-containing protein n=1 Tax=Collybiopsis confluens TaxID=2823264 RepID=A0A8H5H5L1_9AGAR|nr:hypothetical protein D9757_008795 [Collybiopsis confluens]
MSADDERTFLLMDLSEAGTLQDVILNKKFYAAEDRDAKVKSLFLSILDGVEHCHQLEVYHRDLKPENILCSSTGDAVKIADFGLATDERCTDTFGCGTRAYISPESLDITLSGSVTSPCFQDLWALGVILINIVARRNPWRSATLNDVGFKAYLKHPEYLHKVLDISAEVAELLSEMFTLDLSQRLHIWQIRDRVMAIEKFFKSSLADSNKQRPPLPPRRVLPPPPRHPHQVPQTHLVVRAPPPLPPRPTITAKAPVTPRSSDSTSHPSLASPSSNPSPPESEGPITPDRDPVLPANSLRKDEDISEIDIADLPSEPAELCPLTVPVNRSLSMLFPPVKSSPCSHDTTEPRALPPMTITPVKTYSGRCSESGGSLTSYLFKWFPFCGQ